jgi:hypothetical protein
MHDYECPLDVRGVKWAKGSPVARCGFVSRGWPSKAAAVKRGKEHEAEHESGKPMRELNEV